MFLIIGASSDVGNEIVKDLIKYDDVILTYRNKNNIKKIKPNKHRIFYEKLDLTDYKNIDKFLKKYSKLLKNIKFINLATAKSDKIIINLNTIDIQNVFKVLFADIMISFDNVIGVVGAAKGNISFMIFGLVLSVILTGAMATYLANYIQKHLWIAYIGLGFILIVAIQLVIGGLADLDILSINEQFKKYF